MIIQTADAISGLSHINLSNLIVIIFTDEIVDARTVDARQLLGLGKQRTGDDVGGHGRQMAADGTDAIGLTVVVYDFKLFADSHISLSLSLFISPVSSVVPAPARSADQPDPP